MSIFRSVFNSAVLSNRKGLAVTVAGLAIFLSAISISPSHAEECIEWTNQVDKGLDEAKKDHKYVLADVYTDWCGWCKRLDAQTFTDKSLAKYLNGKFVCIKVNAEDGAAGQQLAQKFKVGGFPSALVFDQSGNYIGRVYGYKNAPDYLAKVEEIVANPGAE